MDKNKKFIKTVLPIVAVLVLIESVILISKYSGKISKLVMPNNNPVETKIEEAKVFDVHVVSNKPSLKVGEVGSVSVVAKAARDVSIDSANLYLTFDTSAFEVKKITFDDRLPKPAFAKVSTLKNMIVVNYMITEAEGFKSAVDESLNLVTFEIKPKMAGEFNFELSTGNVSKESATMFVETATSKVLPFLADKLTINVVKK